MSEVQATLKDFFISLLETLHCPLTAANEDALACVAVIEGENKRYNPLNSVVPYGNSTSFNSVGVQDYKTFANGVNGTAKLLQGSRWIHVLAALRAGTSYSAIISAFANVYASWGSHPHFTSISITQDNSALRWVIGVRYISGTGSHTETIEYTVEPGDTLYGIAAYLTKKTGHLITEPALYAENRATIGSNPDLIRPGEKLYAKYTVAG